MVCRGRGKSYVRTHDVSVVDYPIDTRSPEGGHGRAGSTQSLSNIWFFGKILSYETGFWGVISLPGNMNDMATDGILF